MDRVQFANGWVDRDEDVVALVNEIEHCGSFALDLEFLSSDRYIPELCVVQIAWGPAEQPHVVALDAMRCDVAPIAALVANAGVEVIMHAAKQDLQILWERYQVRGRNLVDTQVAAALLGLAEQIGYGNLVSQLLDVELDKGAQFTDWSRRPLDPQQLRYALDDVRYLGRVWLHLRERSEVLGRVAWVLEESQRLADDVAVPVDLDAAYTRVRGWANLRDSSLVALRGLARWREEAARSHNTPPQWLLPDAAMIELCRRNNPTAQDLRRLRGVRQSLIGKHSEDILRALNRGARLPEVVPPALRDSLGPREQVWTQVAIGLLQSIGNKESISPRMLGSRADVEEFVRWCASGCRDEERGDVNLAAGWRYASAGSILQRFLSGEVAIAVDETGLRWADSFGGASLAGTTAKSD